MWWGTTGRPGGLQSHTSVQVGGDLWEARARPCPKHGYRDQESNERWQAELSRRWQGDRATHHTWLAILDASWDLPGSVDSLTSVETPEYAPGGKFIAHVQRRRALWGHHVHEPMMSLRLGRAAPSTCGPCCGTDKINPFGTSPFFNGYKEESGSGASLRIRQRWAAVKRPSWNLQAEWSAMATLDQGRFGLWDDPQLAELSSQRYDLTVQWQGAMDPGNGHESPQRVAHGSHVAASARARTAEGMASDAAYSAPFHAAEWLPRVGISKTLGPNSVVVLPSEHGLQRPHQFRDPAV